MLSTKKWIHLTYVYNIMFALDTTAGWKQLFFIEKNILALSIFLQIAAFRVVPTQFEATLVLSLHSARSLL